MATLSTALLALALALSHGAPEAAVAPTPAEQTKELFDTAATQYETSDYNGAVDTYTQAYRLSFEIEDEGLLGRVQAAILFNLGRAHSKAYALDGSAEHLRQELDLLNKYLAQTADLADELEVEGLLRAAETELARLDEEAKQEARDNEDASAARRPAATDTGLSGKGRGMKIGGYSLLGVGLAAGGVSIGGAVLAGQAADDYAVGPTRTERNDAEQKGSIADAMIIGGAVSAGVFVAAGIALVVMGNQRERRVTPTAWVTPTRAGLGLTGSF